MMQQFIITERAQKDLGKIQPGIASQIKKKLNYFFSAPNPMVFAESLIDLPPATHRFRVGGFRIKFFRKNNIFYITRIQPRNKVYQAKH